MIVHDLIGEAMSRLDYLRKLPSFDPEWSDEVKDKWMDCFALLWGMPKEKLNEIALDYLNKLGSTSAKNSDAQS